MLGTRERGSKARTGGEQASSVSCSEKRLEEAGDLRHQAAARRGRAQGAGAGGA